MEEVAGSDDDAAAPAGSGQAMAALDELTVKGRAPKTGYDRKKFGSPWADTDGNSCNTRDDILQRDLDDVKLRDDDCTADSGTLTDDPYTGTSIPYEKGRSKIDIEHIVALGDAWQKGAHRWDPAKRIALANDPLNLLAVEASANRQKGDADAATWLPSNTSFRCEYIALQIAVKQKYELWVTAAEKRAMSRVLTTCPAQQLPTGDAAPTEAPPRFSAPK
ncbi:HNH endonuclease family protein [Streptomyces gobiensis]|nr:HNH endonuclease family protein [Streptomyces gobiensis]UGY94986.1 HNH endonuclease family protein [Streptomyces gobiensis]